MEAMTMGGGGGTFVLAWLEVKMHVTGSSLDQSHLMIELTTRFTTFALWSLMMKKTYHLVLHTELKGICSDQGRLLTSEALNHIPAWRQNQLFWPECFPSTFQRKKYTDIYSKNIVLCTVHSFFLFYVGRRRPHLYYIERWKFVTIHVLHMHMHSFSKKPTCIQENPR